MKIGTAILFGLVLVFFAAFLVSANAQASAENHQLWESLSMVEAENLALKAQVQELTALLKAKQASLNKMQAQNENLIAHTETLTIERDQALAQAVQTQQALEQHRMICTQTNPFADSIFALTGRTDFNFWKKYHLLYPAYCGSRAYRSFWRWLVLVALDPPSPSIAFNLKPSLDEVWIRMTR